MTDPRILWVSDSPGHPSGYGTVTENVCGRLRDRGYHVDILGWQTSGAGTEWHGTRVWPAGSDTYGADVLPGYLEQLRPDLLITLGDVYGMSYLSTSEHRRRLDAAGTRWVLYYPVDGATPDGRLPPSWVDVLTAVDVRVTMSEFGREVTAACGLDAECVPHGVDLNLFQPPGDKRRAKARFGYQDAFVILSDAQNQPRKLIPRTLEIATAFLGAHPDAILHLHCDPNDSEAPSERYRYRIPEDVAALGLTGRVRFTEGFHMRRGGVPRSTMAELYAASDAHLLCSYGEGFGLPSLQAAATGVPPVAVGYSASRELVAGHGFAIPTESVAVDNAGFARHLMNRADTVAALETVYSGPRDSRSAACRAFAAGYGWDRIVDRWERLLAAPPRHRTADSIDPIGDRARKGELPIPVDLPRESGAEPRRVILTAPGDAAIGARLCRLFPGLETVEAGAGTPGHLELLLRSIAALDFTPGGVPDIDLACAALGVPYAGRSRLWPALGDDGPFRQARRMLTDYGLSDRRRDQATRNAEREHGAAAIKALQERARSGSEQRAR